MKLNFADVETTNFDPVPKGKYHVKATDYELREAGENAKNPGSEYYNWELTIQDGEYANRKLFTNTSLLPNALFALKGMLQSTGKWTKEELDSAEFDFDPEEVLGVSIYAVVEVTTYNGDKVNNVKGFRTYEGQKSTTSSGSVLP